MGGETSFQEPLNQYVVAAHCLRVSGYTVDYEKLELCIRTERDNRRLALRFEELLAHHFDHASCRNVIYDVSTVPLDEFITSERRRLIRTLRYGFPVKGKGLDDLRQSLSEQGYSVLRYALPWGCAVS